MIINGKEEDVATPITVAELVEQRGLRAARGGGGRAGRRGGAGAAPRPPPHTPPPPPPAEGSRPLPTMQKIKGIQWQGCGPGMPGPYGVA